MKRQIGWMIFHPLGQGPRKFIKSVVLYHKITYNSIQHTKL